MSLYDKMQNILGKDIIKELEKSINETKESLNNLTKERMCKVYNGNLYEILKNKHISSKLINTLDLGLSYEHVFILVYDLEYVLIDLTYSQFNNKDENNFKNLLDNGYQKINDLLFNTYLRNIENNNEFYLLEDVFYDLGYKR